VGEVLAGFDQGYRLLMRFREELLEATGPMKAFGRCSSRIVLRATRIYGHLLRRSLMPRLLVNGVERSLEFEGLSRAVLAGSGGEDSHVFQAEVEALERLDVPYFEALTMSDILCGDNGVTARGVLAAPSFDDVAERIRSLSDADLEFQSELIRASFALRDAKSKRRPAARPALREATPPAMLVREAERIGQRIAARAIWQDGAAYWIGADYNPFTDRYALQPVGSALYSGRGGMAVFLAALHIATGKPEYRRLALGAARSISNEWLGETLDRESTSTLARSHGIGGATGMGSVVYALVRTGTLLDEPELVLDALRISQFITAKDIDADEEYDVIAGAAGAILGLLPLYRKTADSVVRDRIVQCARHLVERETSAGGWPTARATQPLTGFSHGVAGIVYALFHAHALTGDPAFREAARRGLAYERSVFVTSENNWPDFRPQGTFGSSWCHGAPGIGLSRVGCLSLAHDSEFPSEIESAAQWMLRAEPVPQDHLCCGELGNVEFLLEAGRRMQRPDWVKHAQVRGAAAFARSRQDSDLFKPGLFSGLAGIGYEMLRLAVPDRIPSVLLWE
jgi:type 2 lantibiotic biosynthesis protein LanM